MIGPVIITLAIIFPIILFAVSQLFKFPFEQREESRAIRDSRDDFGQDFYFVGLTALISITVDKFGELIPAFSMIAVVLYAVGVAVVTFLNKQDFSPERNYLCLIVGVSFGLSAIVYSLYLGSLP